MINNVIRHQNMQEEVAMLLLQLSMNANTNNIKKQEEVRSVSPQQFMTTNDKKKANRSNMQRKQKSVTKISRMRKHGFSMDLRKEKSERMNRRNAICLVTNKTMTDLELEVRKAARRNSVFVPKGRVIFL